MLMKISLNLLLLLVTPIYAETAEYSINYPENISKKGIPPLENADVIGQIFLYGIPRGFFQAKTNESGHFSITHDYGSEAAIAIDSIVGEEKYHDRCSGNALPGQKIITIKCQPFGMKTN